MAKTRRGRVTRLTDADLLTETAYGGLSVPRADGTRATLDLDALASLLRPGRTSLNDCDLVSIETRRTIAVRADRREP